MKLGSIADGGRDGTLAVLDSTLTWAAPAAEIAPTLQAALENWADAEKPLRALSEDLEAGKVPDALRVADLDMASPLPRTYQFLDGSGYLGHMQKARAARGAAMPANWDIDPVMYQGLGDSYLSARDQMRIPEENLDLDYEAELAVIVDDVPMGTQANDAAEHIKLVVLLNDYTLRALTKTELPRGFGFMQAKPTSGFAVAAVTPDELGQHWDNERFHLRVRTTVNGRVIGEPNSGVEMHFSYPQFIAHAARTRELPAGTIIGAGTISNDDTEIGFGCLAEIRQWENEAHGAPQTRWLRHGDLLEMEAFTGDGRPVFGGLEHRIVALDKLGGESR